MCCVSFAPIDTGMDTIAHSSVPRSRGVCEAHMHITRRFEQGRRGMCSVALSLELS